MSCCVHHLAQPMVIRATLVLSFVTFRGQTSGLASSATARLLRLCAFRSRSRNTYGFEPLDSFELPLQEFVASASASPTALATDEGRSSWIRLQRTRGSDAFRWIDSPMANSELIQAASRCVRWDTSLVQGKGVSIDTLLEYSMRLLLLLLYSLLRRSRRGRIQRL